MTRYEVKLTQEEVMGLQQLTMQPGFDGLLKLLQGESLAAQAAAMQAKGSRDDRLLALTDAQRTAEVVSNLTKKLCSYRNAAIPQQEPEEETLAFEEVDWTRSIT